MRGLLAAILLPLSACGTATQLLVDVSPAPDLPSVDAVVVEVLEAQTGEHVDGAVFAVTGTEWSRSFAIVPRGGDARRRVRVVIVGCTSTPADGSPCAASDTRARQEFAAGFVAGHRIEVPIQLSPMCSAIRCPEGYTCSGDSGQCAPIPGGAVPPLQTQARLADESCAPVAPTGTAMAPLDLEAHELATDEIASGLEIQFFPDDAIDLAGCMGTCARVTTDASGRARVSDAAGSWFAYRVAAQSASLGGVPATFSELLQTHAPAIGTLVTISAIQPSTVSLIAALAGVPSAPGRALVVGRVHDCDNAPVENASLRLSTEQGQLSSDFTLVYYRSGAPDLSEVRTGDDGLYAIVNVPVPIDHRLHVEVWGAIAAGDPQTRVGCEEIFVDADATTILDIGPTRLDGPASCRP